MIVCRDCKYLLDDAGDLFCEMRSYQGFLHFPEQTSCIHAERADGLTECCATCSMNYFGRNCKMWHWTFVEGSIDLNSMCCKEDWQPREEKE